MNKLNKELDKMKKEIDDIEVPDELESLLRSSLDGVKVKKRLFNYKSIIVAAALAIFFIGYNADAISYYGKRMIGYESIMSGTLKDLNELGSGQTIDKSYTFKDGTQVTLDGIMLDDNSIVVFYTAYNNGGYPKNNYMGVSVDLRSGGRVYSGGGQGELSQDGNSEKWVLSYDPPKFSEKNMTLAVYNDNNQEWGEIEFKLDRNKALGKSIKLSIDKNIEVADKTIRINDLIASPITTVVDGTFQNIFELGIDVLNKDRIYFNEIDLELLADGDKIEWQSGGSSTNLKGSYFHSSFDALPKDTKKVELVLKSLNITQDIDEKVDLDDETFPKTIEVLGRVITINSVDEDNGNTYINITSEEDVYLTSLFLNIDGEDIRNEKTTDEIFDKIIETSEGKKVLRTRTVEFQGIGKEIELNIKKMSYNKDFDEIVYSYKIN